MIPKLERVKSLTPEQEAAGLDEGLIHLFLVGIDATWGLFGSHVPFITISSRCALACLNAQEKNEAPPKWAAWLGVFLERIDPGHLQSAMIADFARAQNVQRVIAGQ